MKNYRICASLLCVLFCAGLAFAQPKRMNRDSAASFGIYYELNGGVQNSANPESYEQGKVVKLGEPSREGYVFKGWFKDKKFTGTPVSEISADSAGAVSLYAAWQIALDAATFCADEVVVIPADEKCVLEDFAGKEGVTELYGYAIYPTEVTQRLYRDVMLKNPSYFDANPSNNEIQDLRPVEQVTWYDAVYFCNELTKLIFGESECVYEISEIERDRWGIDEIESAVVNTDFSKKGFRLPTRAEWEMAARGGYEGGWEYQYVGTDDRNDLDYLAWYDGYSSVGTHQVATKLPNALGLYDMNGNVAEWVSDDYGYYSKYVLGGNYYGSAYSCLLEEWDCDSPDYYSDTVGFRLARTLDETGAYANAQKASAKAASSSGNDYSYDYWSDYSDTLNDYYGAYNDLYNDYFGAYNDLYNDYYDAYSNAYNDLYDDYYGAYNDLYNDYYDAYSDVYNAYGNAYNDLYNDYYDAYSDIYDAYGDIYDAYSDVYGSMYGNSAKDALDASKKLMDAYGDIYDAYGDVYGSTYGNSAKDALDASKKLMDAYGDIYGAYGDLYNSYW
ncbi:MAG: SUMF1/EgtB/PvdO family nonheme iron enzyme [Treponemataceae bacterium]|nr:SUMF1/EgtB/PvdO family nonheme iron enzyme [Treponemataceae bacterium]